MSSDDGVAEMLRPCTRSQARAINPSAVRASAGKKATPVRAETLRPPSSPTTRAPKSSTRLASCSNRISSYSSGPYEASTSPGRTHGVTSSPTVSADVPGRDVQAHHGEHTPGRRRLVALLLEPSFEVGVRRQPAHAHRRTPPLDHQRRPPDRDRLAGQHLRALPRLQQVAAQARAVGAARVLDLQHGAHVQSGVVPRGVRLVDAHVVVLVAPDRHAARLRQRVHREEVRPHHDQVEDAVLDGASVDLAHRRRAGCGRAVVTSLLPFPLAQRDEGRMRLAVAQIDA